MNSIRVNNVSFNSRYINIKNPEDFPKRVYDAVYKSDGIDKFLQDGKPKTFWGKVADLFKKDEELTITYKPDKLGILKKITGDPFAKSEKVIFSFGKEGSTITDLKTYLIAAEQSGIKRKPGSIPKPDEHYLYKNPIETVDVKLAKQIEDISDLGTLLKK